MAVPTIYMTEGIKQQTDAIKVSTSTKLHKYIFTYPIHLLEVWYLHSTDGIFISLVRISSCSQHLTHDLNESNMMKSEAPSPRKLDKNKSDCLSQPSAVPLLRSTSDTLDKRFEQD